MNLCEHKHPQHDYLKVMTDLGPMIVYDWSKYMGQAGYCTGQDDVSMTLDKYGTWDKPIRDLIERLLYGVYGKGVFIDVGSHVGYFSKLAAKYGCKVMAYEAEGESLELLEKNVPSATRTKIWFDTETHAAQFDSSLNIDIMKVDIEGSEEHAVRYFSELIDAGRVKNIILEVSPVFNDSYPELLRRLQSKGYVVKELDGSPFTFDFNFPQTNLWLHL